MSKAQNDVRTSAVTLTADDSGKLTARQVPCMLHCVYHHFSSTSLINATDQYVPVKPVGSASPGDSALLAMMEKALFEVRIASQRHNCNITYSTCDYYIRSLIFLCLIIFLLLQWANQHKLFQRAQERNNNEGGVGCLGVQTSLLDPKLFSKEPKHRFVGFALHFCLPFLFLLLQRNF